MASIAKSPIKAFAPLSSPTSSPPRPNPARKVSTATFGHGQRESLLVPVTSQDGGQGDVEAAIIKTMETDQQPVIPETEAVDENPPSPTSFHTAAPETPSFMDRHDPDVHTPPETPQTSTSLASCLSDTSTLGPLATQQDIRDDPDRISARRHSQRKKLEKMLGGEVEVENDEPSGRVTVKCGGETVEQTSDLEDWLLVGDGPNICRSKLERTLGHGADSAHLVLNAEYRRRPSDTDEQEANEEPTSRTTTPLINAVPSSPKPGFRVHSTSDVLGMFHLAETTGKLMRSGSFGNVLESGKKTLARLNQAPSAMRRKRSVSPGSHVIPGLNPSAERLDDGCELQGPNDLDSEERRVLWNRTRKLGRVLGETLNEKEVGEHVVGKSAARKESPVLGTALDGKFQHHDEDPPRQNSSPSLQESRIDGLPPTLGLAREGALLYHYTAEHAVSSPLSPTLKRIRRYSDPVSPGISYSMDEGDDPLVGVEVEGPGTAVERAKQQRRMRLDKLNRLLGSYVPLELLGPAVVPVPMSERPTGDGEDDEDAIAQKKRAVKVASKMFSVGPVFGEPPPANVCLPTIPTGDASVDATDYRSRLKTSVALYHHTIHSIRYLLEHDRHLLHSVMDELDGKTDDVETGAQAKSSSPMQRKRSLSSPTTIVPPSGDLAEDAAQDDAYECFTSLRRRATKLNAFFGDPRIGSGHINRGAQSRAYQARDRKAALLERLLVDLEDDASLHVEDGELREDDLEEIRSRISDTRAAVTRHAAEL